MGDVWTQLFPGQPHLTEENLPSQEGRVFIVTGGNAGIGLDVVKMIYAKGGTVYMAGRSRERIDEEVRIIKDMSILTPGIMRSLIVDFGDLETISQCACDFLDQEDRLDVLFNNAGTAQNPIGSITEQGYEAHMGTNCLGPYLLTKLLLPTLVQTAQKAPRSSVRIVFTSSGIIDMVGPPSGLSIEDQARDKHPQDKDINYSASKAGNWFMALELDKRVRQDNVVCVAQNPGTLKTKGWDKALFLMRLLMSLFMHDAKMGAYTTLWAGLSSDVTPEDGGKFAIPWGRRHPDPKKDLVESIKSEEEGGTGLAV